MTRIYMFFWAIRVHWRHAGFRRAFTYAWLRHIWWPLIDLFKSEEENR
jgi:hypothetical protein